jgi:putative Mg2+ transporter-C (MgtC) family protein
MVSGIGFLGAGVIFKDGLNVRGLNTAATLWCSAAVGLLAGEGYALYGMLAAVLVISANTLLRPIVRAIKPSADRFDRGGAAIPHHHGLPRGAR